MILSLENMNVFEKLGLNKKITEVLKELGYTVPTDIQEKTIPLILKGNDVIGNAFTGSGKTLAFASGVIENSIPGKGVQSLILAPTRELAEQITKVMRVFAKNYSLRIIEIYGGVSINTQIRNISHSEIVVGTPGRILDHLQRGTLRLSSLKILVLDEADRMVDMGFLRDVEKIISQCPKERQTLLFSATSSPDVQYIERKYMRAPKNIVVEQYVDASQLQQEFYNCQSHMKFSLLVHFLKQEKSGIVLVFCNTRRNVDMLSRNLKRYEIDSHAIHGGFEQRKRSRVIEMLHSDQAHILICTDVAARGLDIKNVSHVYNYDIPRTSDEYIHRVGRTARAGKSGIAVNLVSSKDYENFRKVLSNDAIKIEEKEIPKVEVLSVNFQNKDNDYRGNRGSGGSSFRGGGRSFGGSRGRSSSRSSFGSNRGSSGGGFRSSGGFGRSSDRGDSGERRGQSSFGRREGGGRSFGGGSRGRSSSGSSFRGGGRSFGGSRGRSSSRSSFGRRRF